MNPPPGDEVLLEIEGRGALRSGVREVQMEVDGIDRWATSGDGVTCGLPLDAGVWLSLALTILRSRS